MRDPEKLKAKARRYYLRNRERLLARSKAYQKLIDRPAQRKADPEKHRAADWIARQRDPGKAIADNARAKARARGLLCTCCKPKDIVDLYRTAHEQGNHVDHIKARALGGLHCKTNLQILTPAEHAAKTTLDRKLIALAGVGQSAPRKLRTDVPGNLDSQSRRAYNVPKSERRRGQTQP